MSASFDPKRRATREDFLYAGTVLRMDIPKSERCQCPDRCNHVFTRGTCYVVRDHFRKDEHNKPLEFEVGPTCAKKYDPAFDPKKENPFKGIGKPAVPVLTAGIGSLSAFRRRPSTRLYAARGQEARLSAEQSERLRDEAYLQIWGQRLPELNMGFKQPPSPVLQLLEDYETDPEKADISKIRQWREYRDPKKPRNSFDTLQSCYAMATYLGRCVTKGTREYAHTTNREQKILPRYIKQLVTSHQLSDRAIGHLNGILMRAYPRALPFEVSSPKERQENLLQVPVPNTGQMRTIYLGDPDFTATIPVDRPAAPGKEKGGYLFGT